MVCCGEKCSTRLSVPLAYHARYLQSTHSDVLVLCRVNWMVAWSGEADTLIYPNEGTRVDERAKRGM